MGGWRKVRPVARPLTLQPLSATSQLLLPYDKNANWAFRPAEQEDVDAIAELRAVVMRPDLERLGRLDVSFPIFSVRQNADAFLECATSH